MLKTPLVELKDFAGGLITDGGIIADKETINKSLDCLNVHTDASKRLLKRSGFTVLNSVSAGAGAANGAHHYVQSATVQQLVAFFGATVKKMDLVDNVWDGTWDTISKAGGGTQLTASKAHFATWSKNGTLIICTEAQNVPQRVNATDTDYINLHAGGSGTAPSGKYPAVWKDHTWIANISGNNDRLQRSAVDEYDDWDGTDSGNTDIVTEGDIGLTGVKIYKGNLYVFKKWSIHRVTYLGGSPLLDFKPVAEIGTASPESIITINIPGQGDVLAFLGTDRQLYVFNGWEAVAITKSIYEDGEISDYYMKAINALQLNKVHAVNYNEKNQAIFFVPMTSGEVDIYTKLLLHCDGVDGSTSIIDDTGNHTVTAQVTAQIDTAQSVFGSAALSLDGNSDLLTINDSTDWNLGAGDWTLESRIRLAAKDRINPIISHATDGNNYATFHVDANNKLVLEVWAAGAKVVSATGTTALTTATWYHVAIVHDTNYQIFLNGVSEIDAVDAQNWGDYTGSLVIGRLVDNAAATSYYQGWMDEIRVSKGIARWTADFTPPTRAYGGPSDAIVYDYVNKSFWPYDNMNFGASCIADDGTGQRKAYVFGSNYGYLFDDGTDDNGTDINAYWTSMKIDYGYGAATLKKTYNTELLTNNAAFGLAFQQRQDWNTAWSTSKTLTQSREKHVLQTNKIGNLIQYKLTDDSSNAAFKLLNLSIPVDKLGVG